jgi:hypothetical protein
LARLGISQLLDERLPIDPRQRSVSDYWQVEYGAEGAVGI